MSKPLDPDLKVLRACVKALRQSTSVRMLAANMNYLNDRFIVHPKAEDIEQIQRNAEAVRP